MRFESQYKGGLTGSWGYFDRSNIQSSMLGYNSAHAGPVVCASAIDEFPLFLSTLFVGHISTDIAGLELPRINTKDHSIARTQEILENIVHSKYDVDLSLWATVRDRRMVCW
jgi:hypothetical protein